GTCGTGHRDAAGLPHRRAHRTRRAGYALAAISDAGLYVVRPPGDHPSRKVRVFTDVLVERLSAQRNVAPGKPRLPGASASN
ncbi:MAG TPA: hypothetical protein VFS58_04760, partial [Steroidobacteraceae bacterium]|nr:hypothetical protein [Steroidobacteraceae bacterium]